MRKNNHQMKSILLALLVLVSPILWMVLGNMPVSFSESASWIYVTTFAVLALAVYFAFDRKK